MTEPKPPTILIVDDSEDNRYAVIRHLEKAGFRVLEAEDGATSLQLMEQLPDLVILDVDLPDMSGFEVCNAIKSTPATSIIPVLHLSATFTKTRHRVQGLEGGADGYLCHPVEPLELIATVNSLLRLKQSEQALREANRRKDEFLAMLAHELRNPLAPIRNAVEVLRLCDGPDPLVRSARNIVDRQVTHMARLVDDLLDVTRIARGKVTLRKERCDLTRIVKETANDYRPAAEANHLRLDVHAPDAPLWVAGDNTRLAQIVGNLLQNSVKFTDRGGEIHIDVVSNGPSHACIRVRDNGIGMEAATMEEIFEPFSQADGSLDRSRGGLGLGLALVKGLAELHGGEVVVASDGPGRGTCFTVRLRLDPSPGPPACATPHEVSSGPPRRVLIIEDNIDAANSLKILLELLGHAAEVAVTGSEGTEAAERFQPDFVFCDIGLPGMDGYAVARSIRKSSGSNNIYLVAVTGYGQQEDREQAHEAGFDIHLTKPVELVTLKAILANPPQRGSASPHFER